MDRKLIKQQADLGDKESVRKAVEGSHTVFGVTNCMRTSTPSRRVPFRLSLHVSAEQRV